MEAIGEEQEPLSSPFLSQNPISQRKSQLNSDLFAEVKRLLELACPLIAATLLQYSLQLISIMFVGHLGDLPLSGASMATSFANVSGFSVLVRFLGHLLLGIVIFRRFDDMGYIWLLLLLLLFVLVLGFCSVENIRCLRKCLKEWVWETEAEKFGIIN